MPSYLDELYAHQEWADAEHWRALEAHAAALADKAIRERLHHIHLVQAAFLWVVGGRRGQFVITKAEDYANIADLKAFARRYHAEMAAKLGGMDDVALAETIEVPWFQPALKISVRHALTQAAMHSHYHRGQNATRLRELGGVPPGTDFIEWLRQGQPGPRWE
ncbi:MAG: DinB family protein [Candidatus Sulfotelmatobacter sp.]